MPVGAKFLRRAVLLLVAIIFLVGGVPALLAWRHFSATPTFEAWVESTRADDRLWEERVYPGGEPLDEVGYLGSVDPADDVACAELERVRARFEFEVRHGGRVLADLALDGRAALDAGTNDIRGLRFEPLRVESDPQFRSVLVATVTCPPDAEWALGRVGVGVTVDSFVLAGEGADRILVHRSEDLGHRDLPPVPDGPGTGLIELLGHSSGAPPSEGIFQHGRLPVELTWRRWDNNRQGMSLYESEVSTTDGEYSWSTSLRVSELTDAGEHLSSTERESQRTIEWGGLW